MANEDLAREVSRRLSPGIPADLGAGWFEGLSQRNRYALLARQPLWEQLAGYIAVAGRRAVQAGPGLPAAGLRRLQPRTRSGRSARTSAEHWGVNADAAKEALEQPLTEAEEQTLKDLNEFDFDDI